MADPLKLDIFKIPEPAEDIGTAARGILDMTPDLGPKIDLTEGKNADEAASNISAAKRILQDGSMAREAPDVVKREDRKQNIQGIADRHPAIKRYLGDDPDAMAVSHDDVEELSTFDSAVRTVGNLPGAFAQGAAVGAGGAVSGLADLYLGLDTTLRREVSEQLEAAGMKDMANVLQQPTVWWLRENGNVTLEDLFFTIPSTVNFAMRKGAEAAREFGTEVKEAGRELGPSPDEANWVTDVAGAAGQVTANIAMVVFTGGAGGVALLAGQGADISEDMITEEKARREKANEVPLTPEEELVFKASGAAITAIAEKVGLGVLFKRIPAKIKGRIFRAIASVGSEGIQEMVEGIAHDVNVLVQLDGNKNIGFDQALYDGSVGGAAGGIFGFLLPGRSGTRAVTAKAVIDEADAAIQESKTHARSPELSADMRVKAIEEAGIKKVWISEKAILDYAVKQDIGAAEALRQLGIGAGTTVDEGGMIEIDASVYAAEILGTEKHAALSADIAYGPEMMTARQFEERIVEDSKEILARVEELDISDGLKDKVSKAVTAMAAEPKDISGIVKDADAMTRGVIDNMVHEVNEVKEAGEKLIIKGRERQLEVDIKGIEAQIERLDTEIENREPSEGAFADPRAVPHPNKGRGTQRLRSQRDALIEARQAKEQQIGNLALPSQQAALLPRFAQPTQVEGDVKVKAKEIRSVEAKAAREATRAVRSTFKQATKLAQKDAKKAGEVVAELINKLPVKSRGKFNTFLKNAIRTDQLEKRLPVLQARIAQEFDRIARTEITTKLETLLKPKNIKARMQAGRPVSKGVDATETQLQLELDTVEALTIASNAVNMKVSEAEALLEERVASETPDPADAFENGLLAIRARDTDMTAAEMAEVLNDIEILFSEGREAAKNRVLRARTAAHIDADGVVLAALMGHDLGEMDSGALARRLQAKYLRGIARAGSAWNSYTDVLDIVLNKAGIDATELIDNLEIEHHEQNVKALLERWRADFEEAGLRAFGFKTQAELQKEQYAREQKTPAKDFIGADGVTKMRLHLSRAEATKIWMEMQDPTIAETWTDPEGNNYSEAMVTHVGDVMGQKDKLWGEAQMELYQKWYPVVDKIYHRLHGRHLPRNQFYSPIAREGDVDKLGPSRVMIGEAGLRKKVSGRFKTRQKGAKEKLQIQSDQVTLNRYMKDMAHFVETAEQVAHLQKVFNSPRVIEAIENSHGKTMNGQIRHMLAAFQRGQIEQGNEAEQFIAHYNRMFAKAVLPLKGIIGLKQLTSYFAGQEGMTMTEFAKFSGDFFWRDGKWVAGENTALMYKLSILLRARGSSVELDQQALATVKDSVVPKRWQHHRQTVDDAAFIAIRLGDRGAILPGGWAQMQKHLADHPGDWDGAVRRFEKWTSSTQQSSDLGKQSTLQLSTPWARTFTMFMTAPLALLRWELRAIRHIARGKITPGEFGRRIGMMHFAVPTVFSVVASGMSWDTEDWLVRITTGQLANFVIVGDIIHNAVIEAYGGTANNFSNDIPLAETMRQVAEGVVSVFQPGEEWTLEEFGEGLADLAIAGSKLKGVPAQQAGRIVLGGAEMVGSDTPSDILKAARIIGGASPFIAEKAQKREAGGSPKRGVGIR